MYINWCCFSFLQISSFLEDKGKQTFLNCKTEKDRGHRLNHSTAGLALYAVTVFYPFDIFNYTLHIGILAGMWPCGIITLVRELFLAESKSQVYGHLHQYLQSALKLHHIWVSRALFSSYMYMYVHTYYYFIHRVYMLWWWMPSAQICPKSLSLWPYPNNTSAFSSEHCRW